MNYSSQTVNGLGLVFAFAQFCTDNFFLSTDEDLAGDLLLSEAKFPLRRIMPQMQKKFQVVLEKPDLKVGVKILM